MDMDGCNVVSTPSCTLAVRFPSHRFHLVLLPPLLVCPLSRIPPPSSRQCQMQKGRRDRQPTLSGWNPLAPVRDRLRSITHRARRDSGSDTSSTSAGRSSWSWTIFSGSSRTSIATSICSLYGHDYSISAALVEFLEISASNGRRTPDVTVFGALQGVACDPNRAQAARQLTGEASEELASLLQYVR